MSDPTYTPGMKLVLSTRGPDEIVTVERVTPSGIAVLPDGQKVRNGRPYPKPSIWDFRSYHPATDEDIARVKRQRARRATFARLRDIIEDDLHSAPDEEIASLDALLMAIRARGVRRG